MKYMNPTFFGGLIGLKNDNFEKAIVFKHFFGSHKHEIHTNPRFFCGLEGMESENVEKVFVFPQIFLPRGIGVLT